jgi:hypothetical protein
MIEGTKVKLLGITDRNDKQVFGKIVSYDLDGLCIVETDEKVVGILAVDLEEVKK